MHRRLILSTVVAGITLLFAGTGWAGVPAPPVNQDIGTPDIVFGALAEADCRVCHSAGLPDRHHLLYGQPISPVSLVPYPDADRDGTPDTVYACLNCHVFTDVFHNDSKGGFWHAQDKKKPFSSRCTDCHGASLAGDIGPSCYACHDRKWDETAGQGNPAGGFDSFHNDSEDGFWHAQDKKEPFRSGCTVCHGADLTGYLGPSCYACHGQEWDETSGSGNSGGSVVRNCLACHTNGNPHHTTPAATQRDCAACHGNVVDNFDDGHYIPTYSPSLVTPSPGSCADCHDSGADTGSGYAVATNQELHHGTGLSDCSWCHDAHETEAIRVCENCHGPDSLHNIQADSPAPGNIGTIVAGGEDAGYGHVGRDAAPGDSDCWPCHGFGGATLTAISGPIAPTVYEVRPAIVKTGTSTLVALTGSALTNTIGSVLFDSSVVLTAADGSSVTLTPGIIYEGLLKVTIPGSMAPGNYRLRAVKTDDEGDPVLSNAVALQVVPEVSIGNVTASDGMVTIEGSGFGGYASGSGTRVTGKITTGTGRMGTTTIVEATIVSWCDTIIKADFGASPEAVTVNSVFGTDTYSEQRQRQGQTVVENGV